MRHMMKRTLGWMTIAIVQLFLAVTARVAWSTCPTCASPYTTYSTCGKWEAIPPCSYPITADCIYGGKWPAGLHAVHIVVVNTALSPATGKLLIFGHTNNASNTLVSGQVHFWDSRIPGVAEPTRKLHATPTQFDVECSGMVAKNNGKILFIGGYDGLNSNPSTGLLYGTDATYLFDPVAFQNSSTSTDTVGWAQGTSMAYRRYYPTATILPDGRILASAGEDWHDASSTYYSRTHELYDDRTTNPWSASVTNSNMTIYPFLHVLPGTSNRVLNAGPTFPSGTTMETLDLDAASPSWQTTQNSGFPGGATGMFGGKILKSGGVAVGDSVSDQAEVVSVSSNGTINPVTAAASMARKRIHHNLVALPNGTILVVGGGGRNKTGTCQAK